jgi:NitT/TauT family transport system substrate-binding protein
VKLMISRRTVLGTGAAFVALPTRAETRLRVRVGYVPVIGAAPLFVLNGAGWAAERGLDLVMTKFESGPPAVQALASGTLDVLFIGIAPIAVARAKGLPIKVVAASGIGGSGFAVQPSLAAALDAAAGVPKTAFAAFRAKNGRPAKVGALPAGATPTVALRHWLKQHDVSSDDLQIVAMGIEAVQGAMLSGGIDGGTVLEPALTLVRQRNPGIRTVAVATTMYPDLPGVVVSATEPFASAHPDAVVELVRLAIRARDLILAEPGKAAPFIQQVLGGGLVDVSVFEAALRSPAVSFEVDPRVIVEATRASLAFEVEIGDFAEAPSIEGLFEPRYFLEAKGPALR